MLSDNRKIKFPSTAPGTPPPSLPETPYQNRDIFAFKSYKISTPRGQPIMGGHFFTSIDVDDGSNSPEEVIDSGNNFLDIFCSLMLILGVVLLHPLLDSIVGAVCSRTIVALSALDRPDSRYSSVACFR